MNFDSKVPPREVGLFSSALRCQPEAMNLTDYSAFAVPIVITVLAVLLNGLFFYAVITAAVQGALRKHYFWARKQQERESPTRSSLAQQPVDE
jgi:hypothetical protein